VDRWDKSSAAILPMEARGIYREMLSQAWQRGAKLPADPQSVRLIVRATEEEWKRSWPKVKPYWRQDGDSLVNDTQLEIYEKSLRLSASRSSAAAARWSDANRMQTGCKPDAKAMSPYETDPETTTDSLEGNQSNRPVGVPAGATSSTPTIPSFSERTEPPSNPCPACGQEDTVRKDHKNPLAFFCGTRVGGCGHNWTRQKPDPPGMKHGLPTYESWAADKRAAGCFDPQPKGPSLLAAFLEHKAAQGGE
jgi:uncharacterized protein YdaU (DUF1376 family)